MIATTQCRYCGFHSDRDICANEAQRDRCGSWQFMRTFAADDEADLVSYEENERV
jgi:hypothetical protein